MTRSAPHSPGLHALLGRLAEADPDGPRDRPSITISYAQSLDGSIAAVAGETLRLSGNRALAFTHRLRSCHDAILVGIGTVLADDPRLTVRLARGDDPRPVVLDSRLRLPPDARLITGAHPERRPVVATTNEAPEDRASRLEAGSVAVLRFPARDGRVPFGPLLRELRRRGVRRVLVEGGGQVLTSLFAERLADWVVITVAPRLVGGEPALARVPAPAELVELGWDRFGCDLVFAGRPRFEGADAAA